MTKVLPEVAPVPAHTAPAHTAWFALLFTAAPFVAGCDDPPKPVEVAAPDPTVSDDPVKAEPNRVDTRPAPMHQPVSLWEGGETKRKIDAATASAEGYVVLDLGEEWTPYLFTERGSPREAPKPNKYRETYLALARGEFPRDHHGERAKEDKYLELYGIMPTLGVLRERFRATAALTCDDDLDYSPLEGFEGFAAYRGNDKARWNIRHYEFLGRMVNQMKTRQGVESVEAIDEEKLEWRDRRRLREYLDLHPRVQAVTAAQDRLECEGYTKGKGKYSRGALDWATHEALAEFERRHRIYGWGFLGKETLAALKESPLELERRAVVRILTERAMHAAGVIEDGSRSTMPDGTPRTFTGADGEEHQIPNLEAQLEEEIVESFGLETPESALAWLESLGDMPDDKEMLVAFRGPELPEYYDGDMELEVAIDRGDVWYEFPFDDTGAERSQPVKRRPRLTIFTTYLDQRIPLARFGTTIGGWRSESVDGTVMWKYKNSPVGDRVWARIVAAPVWLPPESTPPRELLTKDPEVRDGLKVNYHETGPSYASAYGLVAAYHQKFRRTADGEISLQGDEGIRTHGSVDYMSIMRRHSHGCHRLHNHLAVRLMSFVLAHRPHRRVGQKAVSYSLLLPHDDQEYMLELNQGGYEFELERPLTVHVLEGRIRGARMTPVEHPIPKFNPDAGIYVMPDGGPVLVSRTGELTPTDFPTPDAGVGPDGGILTNMAEIEASDGGSPGTIKNVAPLGEQPLAPIQPVAPPPQAPPPSSETTAATPVRTTL